LRRPGDATERLAAGETLDKDTIHLRTAIQFETASAELH
jgi:hypothetical protein